MITDSFDNRSEPLITPASFLGPQRHLADVCILTFSDVIQRAIMERFPLKEVASITTVNGSRPVYAFPLGDRTIITTQSSVGAPLLGAEIEELNWMTGVTKFILFGSAGAINRAATAGKYVVPTEAYRDEGMSYHYAPPADYITIKNADVVAAVFDELRVPYVKGRVWTTDAFYRETRDQFTKRRNEGCLAVEMELAGVQAVCDFYGFDLYDFLQTGDVLDAPIYDPEGLSGANHDLDKFIFALELARRV